MTNSVIELRNLTKLYGSTLGVEKLNLQVKSGAVVGFLGPNGAGKSTTINMLLDFIRPTSGSVRLFGLDVRQNSVAIRRRIGFLAGDMAMDPGLTGWQQLEYLGSLHGGFDKKYATSLAKRLNCKLDHKFKTLSRGNRQKVGLIASLMHRPELLVLDEPTSGLDPLIQSEFNKIILDHQQSGGTAFISSHVLSEIQEICDTVTFIRRGRLITTKTVPEIIKESPRDFSVTTKSKDLQTKLAKFVGFTLVDKHDDTIEGIFNGDVNKLVRLLSGYTIESFSLSEADLESIFLQYYKGEKNVK